MKEIDITFFYVVVFLAVYLFQCFFTVKKYDFDVSYDFAGENESGRVQTVFTFTNSKSSKENVRQFVKEKDNSIRDVIITDFEEVRSYRVYKPFWE